MSNIPKQFTQGEIRLNKILNELGYQTISQYQIGEYTLDIFCLELYLGFEFDGYGHFSRRDKKRDDIIYKETGIRVIRIKPKELRKDIIDRKIKEIYEAEVSASKGCWGK